MKKVLCIPAIFLAICLLCSTTSILRSYSAELNKETSTKTPSCSETQTATVTRIFSTRR